MLVGVAHQWEGGMSHIRLSETCVEAEPRFAKMGCQHSADW